MNESAPAPKPEARAVRRSMARWKKWAIIAGAIHLVLYFIILSTMDGVGEDNWIGAMMLFALEMPILFPLGIVGESRSNVPILDADLFRNVLLPIFGTIFYGGLAALLTRAITRKHD